MKNKIKNLLNDDKVSKRIEIIALYVIAFGCLGIAIYGIIVVVNS